MTTAQLFTSAMMVAIAISAGCNRTDARREAREAAAGVRSAAANAGDRLADGWLTARVQAKYFADDDIKSRYINVSSRDGVVTLKGFVESDAVREEVLQIARNTDGVQKIDDQLLIGRAPREAFDPAPGSGTVVTSGTNAPPAEPAANVMDDSQIVSLVQARYFLDPAVKRRQIDVSSTSGVVTLRGQVASDNERAQALLLARTTQGVQRVEDSLTVDASLGQPPPPLGASGNPAVQPGPAPAAPSLSPSASASSRARPDAGAVGTSGAPSADATLESALKAKLTADAQLRTAKVEVSARDGVVLLQGTVPSQAAKQRLLTLTRQTEGVMQVVDRVTVSRR